MVLINDDDCMEVQQDPANIPLSKEIGETSEALTASETENPPKGSTRKKKNKNKRSGPSIESQLREVPQDSDELPLVPVGQLGASALEWLEDLEVIRRGSGNLQGQIQSQMKRRVVALKEVIRVLAEKVEDGGDPLYLRRRNMELSAELKTSKREMERLRGDVTVLKRVVEDLKNKVNARDSDKSMVDKASSPPVFLEQPRVAVETVVKRPPLGGIAAPIPMASRNAEDPKQVELELANQIRNLRLRMKNIKQNKVQRQEAPEAPEMGPSTSRQKPRILEDVQVIPPITTIVGDSPVVGSSEWIQAQSKKAKYKAKKQALKSQADNEKEKPQQEPSINKSAKSKVSKEKILRKPPRTAAVAVKSLQKD